MESGKRVFVVDDNALAADGLVRLLKAMGWEAESAYSARDARVYLTNNSADIVLLDIGMPGMDGYELVSALRGEMNLEIPIIALSGYGLVEDRQKALDAGFTAHLTKPVGMKELQETLDSYISV